MNDFNIEKSNNWEVNAATNTDIIEIDTAATQLVELLAGLGVPSLIFIVSLKTAYAAGLVGAAAVTSALARLGFGKGMIAGIMTLVISAVAATTTAKKIAEYGSEKIFKGVVKRLLEEGESYSSIKNKIESYPISKSLKGKLIMELYIIERECKKFNNDNDDDYVY